MLLALVRFLLFFLLVNLGCVLDVTAALSNDVEVFACVEDFVLVFEKEVGNHFLSEGESLEPV